MKRSRSWFRARGEVEREKEGEGTERERGMRRARESCLVRLARSMERRSAVGSLGFCEGSELNVLEGTISSCELYEENAFCYVSLFHRIQD